MILSSLQLGSQAFHFSRLTLQRNCVRARLLLLSDAELRDMAFVLPLFLVKLFVQARVRSNLLCFCSLHCAAELQKFGAVRCFERLDVRRMSFRYLCCFLLCSEKFLL